MLSVFLMFMSGGAGGQAAAASFFPPAVYLAYAGEGGASAVTYRCSDAEHLSNCVPVSYPFGRIGGMATYAGTTYIANYERGSLGVCPNGLEQPDTCREVTGFPGEPWGAAVYDDKLYVNVISEGVHICSSPSTMTSYEDGGCRLVYDPTWMGDKPGLSIYAVSFYLNMAFVTMSSTTLSAAGAIGVCHDPETLRDCNLSYLRRANFTKEDPGSSAANPTSLTFANNRAYATNFKTNNVSLCARVYTNSIGSCVNVTGGAAPFRGPHSVAVFGGKVYVMNYEARYVTVCNDPETMQDCRKVFPTDSYGAELIQPRESYDGEIVRYGGSIIAPGFITPRAPHRTTPKPSPTKRPRKSPPPPRSTKRGAGGR